MRNSPASHGTTIPRVFRAGLSLSLGILMLALLGTPAKAANPSPFAFMQQPISVAAQPKRLLATRFCADKVLSVSQAGTITTFADLPSTGGSCLARDVVVSPGLGGFPYWAVFAVQKQTIYKIPKQGGPAVPFVTIDSLHNSETSLTFDTVGTFGYNLIAMDRLGQIWKITHTGFAQLIVDIGHQIEGGQVAPLGFAPFGGQLLGTDDFTNSVFAVSKRGVETPVVTYDTPESVEFVPKVYCEYLQTGGTLFVASQFGDEIFQFPSSDFANIDDGLHALVMTKAGKIGLLTTDGTTVMVSDFQTDGLDQELEDATFFPCL
jgi:hypothetical protein